MRRVHTLALGAAALLAVAACGSTDRSADSPTKRAEPSVGGTASAAHHKPLRAGEERVTVRMPSAYTPSAPTGVGTDDYRCFLLDPKIAADSFITGFDVRPGNPDVVHHVILFRVPPDLVGQAERKDADTPGEGWTCFGGSGIDDGSIYDAPWLGAWAPGGAEQVYAAGLGERFDAGARIVMQVHYNLVNGVEPDTSAAKLRLTRDPSTTALETRLLPAPVELPCRPGTGARAHRGRARCSGRVAVSPGR